MREAHTHGLDRLIVPKLDLENGPLVLDLPNEVIDPELIRAYEPQGFVPKEELHVTIFGRAQGQYLARTIKENPELAVAIQREIQSTDWAYENSGERYLIVKQHDGEENARQSIIEMVNMPNYVDAIQRINSIAGTSIKPQPVHITLLTKNGPSGIPIVNPQDIVDFGTRIS